MLSNLGSYADAIYYPTIDGKKFYGTEFIVTALYVSDSTTFPFIFAHDAANITITNSSGAVTQTQSVSAGTFWLPSFYGTEYTLDTDEYVDLPARGQCPRQHGQLPPREQSGPAGHRRGRPGQRL